MKQLVTISIILAIFSSNINAQVDSLRENKHHLSLGYSLGFNRTEFVSSDGNLDVEDLHNHHHVFRVAYRYQLNKRFSTELGFSWGVQREKPENPFYGPYEVLRNYTDECFFFNFARFDLLASMNILTRNRLGLNILAGAGANRFVSVSPNSTTPIYMSGFDWSHQLNKEFIGFTKFGAEFSWNTKRNDELSMRFIYNYGFSEFNSGVYSMNFGLLNTTGTYSSALRGFNFGVNYTFTGNAKRQQLNRINTEKQTNTRESRKLLRFEKRKVDINSQYIFIGSGVGINHIAFTPNTTFLRGFMYGSFMIRAGYEKGWKNNSFIEADYYGFKFWH